MMKESGNVNVWVCPGRPENIRKSITNKYQGSYCWALNSHRRKTWDMMKQDDLCLFKLGDGLVRVMQVTEKYEKSKGLDEWPFQSQSGKPWQYAFDLYPLRDVYVDIPSYRSQTLLKNAESVLKLCCG